MAICLECGIGFTPRKGGSQQRFCCPDHRKAYWKKRYNTVLIGDVEKEALRRYWRERKAVSRLRKARGEEE
jgi:hypothetical protein